MCPFHAHVVPEYPRAVVVQTFAFARKRLPKNKIPKTRCRNLIQNIEPFEVSTRITWQEPKTLIDGG